MGLRLYPAATCRPCPTYRTAGHGRARFAIAARFTSTCCRRVTPGARPGKISRPGLAHARAGRHEQAWRQLIADNPFAVIHGRVCYHPYESVCNRAHLDAAVSIHAVERFLGDTARDRGWQFEPTPPASACSWSAPGRADCRPPTTWPGWAIVEVRDAGAENGLEVYAMCEVPNNVLLLDEFAKRFDGFSIGSNDLTQLTLGVDRDSEIVAFDYDERDEGVKEMIRLAVEGCRRNGIHSGLCGQAPSDYPDMAEFLVRLGIDSISLNPDVVVKTTRQILQLQQQFVPL
ncbi:MAG: putative PEP-binding protein [Mycobacterium sp.]|uniref:putative PEP-binding protein n=1 Tax=Mycobacterium sp. TaxID=1785 RepID=UPI003F9C7FB2